ncbi:hypothetical protein BJY52DRAFT_1186544 [Lactarius psammicola]|nr:hypothetical protein BJY52DRAFT_1186544 [Lactarius psammicola]
MSSPSLILLENRRVTPSMSKLAAQGRVIVRHPLAERMASVNPEAPRPVARESSVVNHRCQTELFSSTPLQGKLWHDSGGRGYDYGRTPDDLKRNFLREWRRPRAMEALKVRVGKEHRAMSSAEFFWFQLSVHICHLPHPRPGVDVRRTAYPRLRRATDGDATHGTTGLQTEAFRIHPNGDKFGIRAWEHQHLDCRTRLVRTILKPSARRGTLPTGAQFVLSGDSSFYYLALPV